MSKPEAYHLQSGTPMEMTVPESKDKNVTGAEAHESWPPKKPDHSIHALLEQMEYKPFAVGGMAQIHKMNGDFSGTCFKFGAVQREYDLMKAAGACSVKAYGRGIIRRYDGVIAMSGFLMKLETPFDPKTVAASQRRSLMQDMISVVHALHHKGIVHGDINPSNMLICEDGKLRLCDFAEGRRVDEDPAIWEGNTTWQYVSPTRWQEMDRKADVAPTINDDLYSLGVSIWELYTRTIPLWDEPGGPEAQLMAGKTVNVDRVAEQDVRDIICKYLRYGGAKV